MDARELWKKFNELNDMRSFGTIFRTVYELASKRDYVTLNALIEQRPKEIAKPIVSRKLCLLRALYSVRRHVDDSLWNTLLLEVKEQASEFDMNVEGLELVQA